MSWVHTKLPPKLQFNTLWLLRAKNPTFWVFLLPLLWLQGVARDMFSRIPNLRNPQIFFTKNVLFSFKGAAKCLVFVKINSFSNIFDLNRKVVPCFKWKQEKCHEKNGGFVDSEFVKTCHKQLHFDRLDSYYC